MNVKQEVVFKEVRNVEGKIKGKTQRTPVRTKRVMENMEIEICV